MVGSGVLLELLNYFFLAKRQKVKRLSAELEEARASTTRTPAEDPGSQPGS